MNHPLSAVHTLICDHAQPAVLLKHPAVLQPDHELWQLMQRDIKEARVGFLNQFVQAGGAASLRATVHTYQVTCISLLNRLSEYQTTTEASAQTKEAGKVLCERFTHVQKLLMGELRYLQTHYSLFFDNTQPVPACVWQEKQEKWSGLPYLLHQKWREAGVEEPLLRLVFHPLQKRIAETPHLCYAELNYLQQLLHETETTDAYPLLTATQQLMLLLCRNNYNHPPFTHYLSAQLQAAALEKDSAEAQREYWALQMKQYQCLFCYDGKWLPLLPPVNLTVSQLIGQELLLCEQRIKENTQAESATQTATGKAIPPVKTNLSVGQLAVMVRLLTDCGIIQCSNQSELLKGIAAAVATTKQHTISPESLRVKYYAPDKAALTIAGEYIAKMMGLLRKY